MRELPILFNTEMVRAILDDRKTCTRRVIKDAVKENQEINKNGKGEFELYDITSRCGIPKGKIYNPPYQPGDILYVRETWHKYTKRVGNGESCHLAEFYGYKASIANSEDANEPWKPSIHMPKEAARIWLKVTDVRVERLQDIMEDEPGPNNQVVKEGFDYGCDFIATWNSTIKKSDFDTYGWDSNPYVWVIEFERCEQPGKEQLWRD